MICVHVCVYDVLCCQVLVWSNCCCIAW